MVTCSDEIEGLLGGSEFSVGDLGPAGGYVFYDKGQYSDGWRYLEAAPAGWGGGPLDPFYIFGEYESSFTPMRTETGIGTGEENTAKLVEAMKDDAHSQGIQQNTMRQGCVLTIRLLFEESNMTIGSCQVWMNCI